MATIKLYYDKRKEKKDHTFPLRIIIQCANKTITYSTGLSLLPDQWDGKKVCNHPQKSILNNHIRMLIAAISNHILELEIAGRGKVMSVSEITAYLKSKISPKEETATVKPTFYDWASRFIENKTGNTLANYNATISALKSLYDNIAVEDITEDWLNGLYLHLQKNGNKINTIGLRLQHIRAIYNYIIKHDRSYSEFYPFNLYRIEREQTQYRDITLDELALLWEYGYNNKEYERVVDLFFLGFYLIGINNKDFCSLRPTDYKKGVITYVRAKTGKLYHVKIEPEASKLIKKYRDPNNIYLLDIMSHHSKYTDYTHWMNKYLRRLSKSIFGYEITSYTARYTWANIAHRMGYSKDIISMALGHSYGAIVTNIYIDYDAELVNDANRKIIDCFYSLLLFRWIEPYFRTFRVIFPKFCV